MKPIIILIANILLLFYFIMFFVDNTFFPKETILKIRNILFVLLAIYISYNLLYIYILKKEKPESGLVYKVASITKEMAVKTYQYIEPYKKELLIWTLVASGMAFLSLITVGLPGAFLMSIPVKLSLCKEISGDNAWPAAIFLSLVWPFLLPMGVVVKHHLIKTGYLSYATYGWVGTVIGGVIFLIALSYLMFGKTKS